jgi:hypothetical protein
MHRAVALEFERYLRSAMVNVTAALDLAVRSGDEGRGEDCRMIVGELHRLRHDSICGRPQVQLPGQLSLPTT